LGRTRRVPFWTSRKNRAEGKGHAGFGENGRDGPRFSKLPPAKRQKGARSETGLRGVKNFPRQRQNGGGDGKWQRGGVRARKSNGHTRSLGSRHYENAHDNGLGPGIAQSPSSGEGPRPRGNGGLQNPGWENRDPNRRSKARKRRGRDPPLPPRGRALANSQLRAATQISRSPTTRPAGGAKVAGDPAKRWTAARAGLRKRGGPRSRAGTVSGPK